MLRNDATFIPYHPSSSTEPPPLSSRWLIAPRRVSFFIRALPLLSPPRFPVSPKKLQSFFAQALLRFAILGKA